VAKRRRPRPPGHSAADKAESKLATYMAGSLVAEHSTIPGTDKPFVWRKLSSRQKQLAVAAAVRRLEEVAIPQGLRSYADLEDEIAIQVLHLAMRDPDVEGTEFDPYPRTLATNADEFGLLIDEDTRDLLAIEYRDLEEDTSPRADEFDDEEMRALEDAIEKKSSRLLNSFGPRILRHWLLTSASPQSH
jgi:hypothetical protein